MEESKNVKALTGKGAAGLLAGLVVAASVFTFASHTAKAEDDKEESADDAAASTVEPPTTPQGASITTLTGRNAAESEAFWTQLGLDACKQGSSVPVILLETTRAAVLHYNMQTLGYPVGCRRFSFQASAELVRLIVPKPVTVTLPERSDDDTAETDESAIKELWNWFSGQ